MGENMILLGTEKVRRCSSRDFSRIGVPPWSYQCHTVRKIFQNDLKIPVEIIRTSIIRYERGESSKGHRLLAAYFREQQPQFLASTNIAQFNTLLYS